MGTADGWEEFALTEAHFSLELVSARHSSPSERQHQNGELEDIICYDRMQTAEEGSGGIDHVFRLPVNQDGIEFPTSSFDVLVARTSGPPHLLAPPRTQAERPGDDGGYARRIEARHARLQPRRPQGGTLARAVRREVEARVSELRPDLDEPPTLRTGSGGAAAGEAEEQSLLCNVWRSDGMAEALETERAGEEGEGGAEARRPRCACACECVVS